MLRFYCFNFLISLKLFFIFYLTMFSGSALCAYGVSCGWRAEHRFAGGGHLSVCIDYIRKRGFSFGWVLFRDKHWFRILSREVLV